MEVLAWEASSSQFLEDFVYRFIPQIAGLSSYSRTCSSSAFSVFRRAASRVGDLSSQKYDREGFTAAFLIVGSWPPSSMIR